MKVLASCDPIYYKEHSDAFINSCKHVGLDPHIEVLSEGTKEDFARNRFLIAEKYLEPDGVLITDIDCYFNKKLPPIKEDVGIFLREYENYPGMKVAAGLLWLNNTINAKTFILDVKDQLLDSREGWYADQIALYSSYNKFKDSMSFFIFNNNHMDWEFNENSYI